MNETKLGSSTRFDLPGYNCASRLEASSHGGSHGSMIMVRADIDDVLEMEDVKIRLPRHEIIGIQIRLMIGKKYPSRLNSAPLLPPIPINERQDHQAFSFNPATYT